MTKKSVTIVIAGTGGTGKAAIAARIRRVLQKDGIDVCIDPGQDQQTFLDKCAQYQDAGYPAEFFAPRPPEDEVIAGLSEKIRVDIGFITTRNPNF